MKKFIVTILAFLYLVTSAGATFHMHYCMGKVYAVNLISAKDDCSKCGMKSSNNCCDDEIKTVKSFDTHHAIGNYISLVMPVAVISTSSYNINFEELPTPLLYATNNNSPPGTLICILNCAFRL